MTMNERRQVILELLQKNPDCNINDLIKHFNVTPATIRRDLAYMEKMGDVRRTHGAVHLAEPIIIPGFNARSNTFSYEKMEIARTAAQLITDRDSVILDSGTTTCALAKVMANRSDLNIITNSVAVILSVPEAKSTVMLTGGVYDPENMALIGPDAEAAFSRISASILFLGTTGIRGIDGLTTATPFQASIKRQMISCAKKRVLVTDNSKFDKNSMFLFASFRDIDTIITAYPITDPKMNQHLDKCGVERIAAISSTEALPGHTG